MVKKDFMKHWMLYLMVLPIVIHYIVWSYGPMYGIQLAFKDFKPRKGIIGSQWVGWKNFTDFFTGAYAWRVIRNTILINFYSLLWAFPIPIVFALMLNELRSNGLKRTVQTITYMPYFISLVVMCGILTDFCGSTGVFGEIQRMMGVTNPKNLLGNAKYFRTIYIASGIWQHLGWDSIIFISALTGIDPELFEAAKIDGAGRFKQILHVSIPGILPTIMILLIMRIGSMMNVGFEKIILLYNGLTYETADVISSFAYRKGLIDNDFGYSTAVGLFNSLVNMSLVLISNKISDKLSGTSLW